MSKVKFFPEGESSDLTEFWLNFGEDPDPPIREKMLYLTIREVALVGPASFNTMGVCDTLGITYPMVNHYFGNRDGLVAEAGFFTYRMYIGKIWENVEKAKAEPEARLLAWMEAQVSLNVELRGWGTVLNYSPFSQTIFQILEEKFGQERQKLFEVNLARLAQLIKDVRENKLTNINFTVDSYPRAEFLLDPKLVELSATIALSTLGLAVWKSGGHVPSQGITEAKALSETISKAHMRNMIRIAKEK
jgi:AcrR family transcriptional regulator